MMPSNLLIVQFCMIAIFMFTYSASTEISQSLDGTVHSHHTEHKDHSKQALVNTDEDDEHVTTTDSDEEYFNEYLQHWPNEKVNKRYTNKVIRAGSSAMNAGDNRLWAIPYRFGKRSAMPYRFGKRAAMHFRLGKKSASL